MSLPVFDLLSMSKRIRQLPKLLLQSLVGLSVMLMVALTAVSAVAILPVSAAPAPASNCSGDRPRYLRARYPAAIVQRVLTGTG